MKIRVFSRAGNLLKVIDRKPFMGQDKEGFPEKQVKYQSKKHSLYDLKKGKSIFPYGSPSRIKKDL